MRITTPHWLKPKNMWLGVKSYFSHLNPTRTISVVVMASLLLVVGTYGIWRLQRYVSPESGLKGDNTAGHAYLRSAIKSTAGGGLVNSVDDTSTIPNYSDNLPLEVKITGGSNYNIPRIQINTNFY